MKRALFTTSSAISLVLCLAIAGAWARSYWREEFFQRSGGAGYYTVTVSLGQAALAWDAEPYAEYGSDWQHTTFDPAQPIDLPQPEAFTGGGAFPTPFYRLYIDRLGFAFVTHQFPITNRIDHTLRAPLWFPMAMFAVLPGAWLVRRARQRSRRAGGYCESCGYDLRASTSRCPECGMSMPKGSPQGVTEAADNGRQ